MKRREFIKLSMTAGAAGLAAPIFIPAHRLFGYPASSLPYDLVAVRGAMPDVMFDQAMSALGGIKRFVKPNQTVVVKPNIGWDTEPERAACTNPLLVKRIVRRCLEAGAKKVYVFDHTCDVWTKCYSSSGIETAAKEAGGVVVPGNSERYFQHIDIPKGKRLQSAKVHELILESDIFINVPILKSHSSTRLSLGMKNNMGIVWDRGFWHSNGLNQCIADFASFKKPDLTVIDGYRMMKRNGPRGVSVADVVTPKTMIVSQDPVAADAAAAKIFGLDPLDIGHILMAAELGVGTTDLNSLKIKRIKLTG